MYTGPNNLADLGEFTITEEDFRPKPKQRVNLLDWLNLNFSHVNARPEIHIDSADELVYIGYPKPTDCEVYYEVWGNPWEIIWAEK